MDDTPAPWTVTIFYRTRSGVPLDVEYDIHELEELAQIVDLGPDIDTVLRIVVDYNYSNTPKCVEDVMLKGMI